MFPSITRRGQKKKIKLRMSDTTTIIGYLSDVCLRGSRTKWRSGTAGWGWSAGTDIFLVRGPFSRTRTSRVKGWSRLARKRYLVKLQIDGEVFPDPYGIDEKDWINGAITWPDLQFGDIYTYSYEGNIHT